MGIVTSMIAFCIVVLVLVSIHEYGHFLVARLFKIKVLQYCIGFGKPRLTWRAKSGTAYSLAIIPLGGYVKLLDETEAAVGPKERHLAFNNKPVWVRFLVVLAGPVTNFLLAIICFWLVFVIGVAQVKPVIGEVLPDSIAAKAGLKPMDQILAIDGRKTPSWQKVILTTVTKIGEKGQMRVVVQPFVGGDISTKILDLNDWRVSGLSPEPLQSLGIKPYFPPIPAEISQVLPNTPAQRAGILAGDQILAVNQTAVKNWVAFVEAVQAVKLDEAISLEIKRGDRIVHVSVKPEEKRQGLRKVRYLGVASEAIAWPKNMLNTLRFSSFAAVWPAVQETGYLTEFNLVVLKKMFLGQISLKSLGGPITIFRTANLAFKQGFVIFISFLGLISLMLGFVNLLPIPGLDGGHLLFYLIEFVARKPLPIHLQTLILRLGFTILILLMIQATVNDVLRLIN